MLTNGTPKAEAHGGYGLVEVRKLLENSFAMVPIRYEHWDSMLGTVLLQNPRLVARGSDQQGSPSQHREKKTALLFRKRHTLDGHAKLLIRR